MPEIKERPILFSAHMVRAILAGQKTVTRRIVKPQYLSAEWSVKPATSPRHKRHTHDWWLPKGVQPYTALPHCPYGQPGQRLWVRETFNTSSDCRPPIDDPFIYAADLNSDGVQKWAARWKPSIHMPRAASRILLEITDVRVERLQAISRADIRAEGLQCPAELASDDVSPNYRDWYPAAWRELWESINGPDSWTANPWVWVVEFKRVMP